SPHEYWKITLRGVAKVSFKESELVHRWTSDDDIFATDGISASVRDEEVVNMSSLIAFHQSNAASSEIPVKAPSLNSFKEDL
ncbi:hypothetical protein Dimus_033804, partial [Dionaea muscipula]